MLDNDINVICVKCKDSIVLEGTLCPLCEIEMMEMLNDMSY